MKDLRDLKDLTIHDVKPISDESGEHRPRSGQSSVSHALVFFFFFFFITLKPRVE